MSGMCEPWRWGLQVGVGSPRPGAVAGTIRVRGARRVPDARVGPCPWKYGNQAKKALYTALDSFTAEPVEVV